MAKKVKLPKDTNQKAKTIVDLATSENKETPTSGKNAAAVELGRKGGLKGGKARDKVLSKKRKIEIAKQGAAARWGHK
ncbi:MAG TPA: hypothetical protein VGI82_08820 [Chitinophagaceae bacterium]